MADQGRQLEQTDEPALFADSGSLYASLAATKSTKANSIVAPDTLSAHSDPENGEKDAKTSQNVGFYNKRIKMENDIF